MAKTQTQGVVRRLVSIRHHVKKGHQQQQQAFPPPRYMLDAAPRFTLRLRDHAKCPLRTPSDIPEEDLHRPRGGWRDGRSVWDKRILGIIGMLRCCEGGLRVPKRVGHSIEDDRHVSSFAW